MATTRRLFKDIHGFGYPYTLVHPYKQLAAKHIVANIPKWVTHVIIFGSAVGDWHYYEKDIDVCLVGKDPQSKHERDYKYQKDLKLNGIAYDFLHYDTLDEINKHKDDISSVTHYILKEGVLIYGGKNKFA
jgi:predicted nucleotidyltransferase